MMHRVFRARGVSSPRKRWRGPKFTPKGRGRGLYIWEQRRVLAVHLHGVGTLGNKQAVPRPSGKKFVEHVSAATALVAFEWVFGATCEPLNLAPRVSLAVAA